MIVVPQLLILGRNTQYQATRGHLVAVTRLRHDKHFAGWSLMFAKLDFPEDLGVPKSSIPVIPLK